MRMRVLNKYDAVLSTLPERYAKQYPDGRYDEYWKKQGWLTATEIRPALLALRPHERTVENINRIMGKNTWTQMNCSCCGGDFDSLARFGDEPDYGTQWQDLCIQCLSDGLELLKARASQA